MRDPPYSYTTYNGTTVRPGATICPVKTIPENRILPILTICPPGYPLSERNAGVLAQWGGGGFRRNSEGGIGLWRAPAKGGDRARRPYRAGTEPSWLSQHVGDPDAFLIGRLPPKKGSGGSAMRISDARTRGPWRKKWVDYIRSLDLEEVLRDGEENSTLEDQYKFFQAGLLQRDESLKILREIRRALTVGDDESDSKSDHPGPAKIEYLSRQFLQELELGRGPQDPEVPEPPGWPRPTE